MNWARRWFWTIVAFLCAFAVGAVLSGLFCSAGPMPLREPSAIIYTEPEIDKISGDRVGWVMEEAADQRVEQYETIMKAIEDKENDDGQGE